MDNFHLKQRRAELEAKVKAVNTANAEAKRLFPILRAFFTQYVGQKILKADGSLLAKIAEKLPALPPYSNPLHVYSSTSDYTLSWTVKTCVPYGEHSCTYWTTGVYIGNLRGGILESLYGENHGDYKTDYNADDVEAKREAYKVAKEAADNALSALHPFGER